MSTRSIPENQTPLFDDFRKTDTYRSLIVQCNNEQAELNAAQNKRIQDAFAVYLDAHFKALDNA